MFVLYNLYLLVKSRAKRESFESDKSRTASTLSAYETNDLLS